jgi:hypothetical protein
VTRSLKPTLTIAEVYGPKHVYAPRAHPKSCNWIVRDPALLDAITANQLAVLGEMPVVCSAGAATPTGLELLAEAGLAVPAVTHTYRDPQNAIEMAAHFAECGTKVVVQHIYPHGVLNDGALWIDARLLSYLNNKANLVELVPSASVASRRVVNSETFFNSATSPSLPVVLKVATDLSTGGGADVAICRTMDDFEVAQVRFAGSERLVEETCLSILRNVCLNYAVMPAGTTRYLGFADQDSDANGRYRGNWISLGPSVPDEVIDIGMAIVTRAASLGYRGFAGIDIVKTDDARWVVLDLNFRVNGSTAAILLAPAIQRAVGPCCLHLRSFACEAGFMHLMTLTRSALRTGRLIPFGTFDSAVAGYLGQPSRLSALIVADSQAAAYRVEAELKASGLV